MIEFGEETGYNVWVSEVDSLKQDNFKALFAGKRVAVLGIGVSNAPLIALLCRAGALVTAHDRKSRTELKDQAGSLEKLGATLCLGPGYLDGLDADYIFRTPGMRPDLPQLAAAAAQGAVLTSEMECFFDFCPCPIIAVTGSDGKTTTTTIIAELLRAAGRTVHLGGNIGNPLLPALQEMDPADVAVVELSSFQLMTMEKSPRIAVVTNLEPNHLDIHKSMEEYVDAKRNIYRWQQPGDLLIVNADNAITASFPAEPGVTRRTFSRSGPVKDGIYFDGVSIRHAPGGDQIVDRAEIKLPGLHNIDNFMAAFAATEGLVTKEIWRRVAMSFAGVEHRIELVRERRGVAYYNDSIASSPSRTIAGLRAFDQKVILIAGGYDKKIPFETLGEEICARVKILILCGDTAAAIRRSVETAKTPGDPVIYECRTMGEAVETAGEVARSGDVVILSPACASFDKYPNFMQRGLDFKKKVMKLS